MPRKRQKLGGYWLEKVPPYQTWYISWYDASSGYRRRRSLGTTDYSEAEKLLLQYAVESRPLDNEDPAAVPVASILSNYLEKHACKLPSFTTALGSAKKLSDFFGDMVVADIKHAVQLRYIELRRKDGVGNSTISRDLSVLRAALNRACQMGELRSAPHIIDLPKAPPRERWLTPEEASRLIAAAVSPHIRLYIMLALHTAARPGAILDLGWDRVDLLHQRIDLNPAGRVQTKKKRPMIPISQTLHAELVEAREQACCPWVIHYERKKLKSIKHAFQRTVHRAGLAGVTVYTLRHTAATWMAQGGVPLWQISGMLGHSITRTTELYAKHHPDFMKEATAALDRIWDRF